jgi:signal transduction histidine kinase
MFKTGFVFIILLLNFCATLAQDNSDIEWYERFFQENTGKPFDEALGKGTTKLDHALETHDLTAQAKALKELGLLHLTLTNDYGLAMDCLIKSLAIEDSLDLKNEQVFTFLAIAKVFEEVRNYDKSAEFLEKALEINEQYQNTDILALILNESGKVNAARGKTEQAFENYEHILKYKDALSQRKVEAEALFNLAQLYAMQGNYNEALKKHKSALAIRRSIKDRRSEARSLNDIGELYMLMKNHERALANHVVALEIRQALKDKKGISVSYNNIGVLYYQTKNFEKAIANLQLGLEAAQESQTQEQIRKSAEYLSTCYKETGAYKQALEYKELFLAISDFIENQKEGHLVIETQNRYVIDQKETQIEKLEAVRAERENQLDTQRRFRDFLFIVIALGLVILLLIIYLYREKQKSNTVLRAANEKEHAQNLELQDLNATKDKFFSIISHDLKGPLNSLTSFSTLLINHIDSLSKEEIQMVAKDLDRSLKNLFALLENLLEWSRSQIGNIEFIPEAIDLGTILEENRGLLQAQAQNKMISVVNANKTQAWVNVHKHSVNTVVRNLISNAIKFTPLGGTVTLDVRQMRNEVVVSISDTGVGMIPAVVEKLFRIDTKHSTKGTANEKGTGLGLILCKEFIEKNGGRIWVESEVGKGSVFYFTLPVVRVPVSEEGVVVG